MSLTTDELTALLAEATPGPWRAAHRHTQCSESDDEQSGLGLELVGPPEPCLRGRFARSADARLAAAAWELAQEVLRLRAAVGEETG